MDNKKWYEKKDELQKLVNENSGIYNDYELKNGEIYWEEQRLDMNAMSMQELEIEIREIKNEIGIK